MKLGKRLKPPFVFGLMSLAVLFIAWEVQQRNVNKFHAKISTLEQEVNTLSGNLSENEKLVLEKDLASLTKEEVALRNGIYVSLIQLSGGIFFSITAYFTWRNVKTAEANLKATEEKQITERFSKSIEHLGSEKLEVRLGGIYSLERIAKDSEKDYWQVIEVLTAFVRQKYSLERNQKPFNFSKTNDEFEQEYYERLQHEREYGYDYDDYEEVPKKSPNQEYIHPVSVEVQAVLNAIGRRIKPQNLTEEENIDLSRTELSGVFLTGNLRGVNFEDSNLQWAKIKDANLSCSNFSGAKLEVVQIESTDLQDASFQDATLQWSKLTNVNLSASNLENANFAESQFEEVIFDYSAVSGTNFRESKFTRVLLKNSNFQDSCLDRIDLSYADLKNLNLPFDLHDATLKCADLENTVFDEAYLKNVNFEEAILIGASFKEANLQDAIFKGANLQKADFTGARLIKTDFRSAVNLSSDQVRQAKHWRVAIYDSGMRKELGLKPEDNEQ